MSTITSRVNSGLNGIQDNYNSNFPDDHYNLSQNGSQLGKTDEFEAFPGEWHGGIYEESFRFESITIPQGAVILSAKITFTDKSGGGTQTLAMKIRGVATDNMAAQSTSDDDARTRAHTTAAVDWDATFTTSVDTTRDTADFTSVIQEIVNRAGWSSGNALGIYIQDDGTAAGELYFYAYYSSYPTQAPLLTVEYTAGSPSPSPSPSVSVSRSPSISPSASQSITPSVSVSLSPSPSPSGSASPSAGPTHLTVMKVAKPGINVLTNSDPEKFKFSSEYGTLKYYTKQSKQVTFTAGAPDNFVSGSATYNHNLGYYPFVEVFVRVYRGSPSGNYEYCPFFASGASVAYSANYKITTSDIVVYGSVDGVSSSTWVFDFLIFVYKNNLSL